MTLTLIYSMCCALCLPNIFCFQSLLSTPMTLIQPPGHHLSLELVTADLHASNLANSQHLLLSENSGYLPKDNHLVTPLLKPFHLSPRSFKRGLDSIKVTQKALHDSTHLPVHIPGPPLLTFQEPAWLNFVFLELRRRCSHCLAFKLPFVLLFLDDSPHPSPVAFI